MEEYDDLATGPIDGVIDLSHDTWRTLPPELSGFSTTLLHLKMSNNNLSTIPASIGDLILLKSLDVSINQIESIDKAIGKCIRLRRLNVASNRIESFPEEIAECILLEEIIARDNRMTTIPQKLANLVAISSLDIRNNRLSSIPLNLCRVPTLNQLLCDNNPQLGAAPDDMRGNSKLLMWCLEMQQKFKDVIDPKSVHREELQSRSDQLQGESMTVMSHIQCLERDIASLEWERPDQYIYWKGRFMGVVHYMLDKLVQVWSVMKRAVLKWWDRKKTHPLY